MEPIYLSKMNDLGYNHLVCDIFLDWESVKDELLIPDRKTGTGNGTIHVFLGAADASLQEEFAPYYDAVYNGEDPSIQAVKVSHYFMVSNIISMVGYVGQYFYNNGNDFTSPIRNIFNLLRYYNSEND